MSKGKRIALRVEHGRLVPADGWAEKQLRERAYRVGDVVTAGLFKARNPEFNKLAHALGGLIAENVEAFEGLDAHTSIKRLQLETGVACDELAIRLQQGLTVPYRVPRSLSFADMDEAEFHKLMSAICKYVARVYWPNCSAEQVEMMAISWLEEAA